MLPATEPDQTLDPRIRRTRIMLADALTKLLRRKEFDRISVQDIADAATVNRATFYAHYPDKFALLRGWVLQRFLDVIVKRGLRFDGCAGATKKMALIVCDFLDELPRRRGARDHLEMHVQMTIVATIRTMIFDGLCEHASADVDNVTLGRASTAAAWAIAGVANEWAASEHRCAAEAVADKIEVLIYPMLASLPLAAAK